MAVHAKRMVDDQTYLKATRMLDYRHKSLFEKCQSLLSFSLSSKEKVQRLYTFVSSLRLGYNANDTIPASRVLRDGYGQCNTKVTLLMALARCAGVPCRVHCYRIAKEAQHGRVPAWMLRFAPDTTVFTWPEFLLGGTWRPLQELVHIQKREWNSCPFDGASWQLEPLRREWIVHDDGIWESQDAYFKEHPPSVHGWRALGWHTIGRRVMNKHLRSLC